MPQRNHLADGERIAVGQLQVYSAVNGIGTTLHIGVARRLQLYQLYRAKLYQKWRSKCFLKSE